jgi:hypothetical protein
MSPEEMTSLDEQEGSDEMNIYRLIYRSKATEPVDLKQISTIVEDSAENNRTLGITGLLLASNIHFYQVLEGSQQAINQVFGRIMRDPRHREVIIVSYGLVAERAFADWSMRGVGLGLLGRWLDGKLREKYGDRDGHVDFPLDEHRAFAFLYDVVAYLKSD